MQKIHLKSFASFIKACAALVAEGVTFEAYEEKFEIVLTGGY